VRKMMIMMLLALGEEKEIQATVKGALKILICFMFCKGKVRDVNEIMILKMKHSGRNFLDVELIIMWIIFSEQKLRFVGKL
jgi:hypothetical protein